LDKLFLLIMLVLFHLEMKYDILQLLLHLMHNLLHNLLLIHLHPLLLNNLH